ncbi:PH domain-containing protein [Lignipirellula cremea]|uniref:Bacterial membrane flanked domain protein n=1 Tax=Lignipirellula cremea TaxID=2528010 RepID=A0A518DR11_9BACT|nr:PH domain-containing protein [Lignipirellula cremea]QDU94273.1 Bacterial membrane flanked domain protein [Lignipirellula cremea]
MNCNACGAKLPPDAAFCQRCGAKVGAAPQAGPKSPLGNPRDVSDDEEVQLWEGGYSGKSMVGSWVIAVLATIGAGVGSAFIPDFKLLPQTWMAIAGVVLLMWVGLGLQLAYRKMSVHYELTTQRFIHKKGLLSRVTNRIEVIDIDDVALKQGMVERMLNVGSIELISSDQSDPRLQLDGVADVQHVFDVIDDARRKERRRRGLHIEAI